MAPKKEKEPEPEPEMPPGTEGDEWTWESYSIAEGEETKDDAESKSKEKPAKKLSKKELKALKLLNSPAAKRAAALEAQRLEEEEKARMIIERKKGLAKRKRNNEEKEVRQIQLTKSLRLMEGIKRDHKNKLAQDRANFEWENYLRCDGLPNPFYCGQLTMYLHLWEKSMDDIKMTEASRRTKEVLQLLDTLTNLIQDSANESNEVLNNWKWIHQRFRVCTQDSLDTGTYRLLRGVRNMNRINLTTADFNIDEDDFSMSVWMMISLPTAMPTPSLRKVVQNQIQLEFPQMSLNVLFPLKIDGVGTVIRTMLLKYDHLTDLCNTYQDPPFPHEYIKDLLQVNNNEWRRKLIYMYDQARLAQKKIPLSELPRDKRMKPLEPDVETIPVVKWQYLDPSPSLVIDTEEEGFMLQIRQRYKTTVEEGVINLRKYLMIGGVYQINVFYQPPQPQELVSLDFKSTRLILPTRLWELPYCEKFDKPPPRDPEIEVDKEELEMERIKLERELEKLVMVTLTLSQEVMWFDTPIVCAWDSKRRVWTTKGVYEVNIVEEKGYVTFRSGMFGKFSFAINRFCNLPFQAWDIKPESNGSITFQLTAAIILIEFNVKENLVCVLRLKNSPNDALHKKLRNKYYRLPHLISLLRKWGIEVFPPIDALCYVENTCEKFWPLEDHMYFSMAQLSICYNFSWSRWNYGAGFRNIVVQMREFKTERTKQVPFTMLLATPLRVVEIDCSETSQVYSAEAVEGMKFYPDLFNMMTGIAPTPVKNKILRAQGTLIATVAELLSATRVLSYC